MKILLGLLVGITFVVALAFWLHRTDVQENTQTAAATEAIPSSTHTQEPMGNAVTDYGPLTIRGTAIMDFSTGKPAVPYIRYIARDDKVWTKQLIFSGTRGCAPGAGDLPCSPGFEHSQAYPQVVTGTPIEVEGYIRDNRFLVTRLSVLDS